MTVGSLFSGIGGHDLGFEWAGFETIWFCEIEKYPQEILARHWPGVPIIEDIRDVTKGVVQRPGVIIGGFPCQDISWAGRGADHLVEVEYVNKSGETVTHNSITFNPFLKTKLIGVLGSSFLRQGDEYADIYYNYKHRLENHEVHKEKSKGHRHNMAVRYMIKIFLIHLHEQWRTIEGLEVPPPYHEAKLGLVHQ